MEVPEGELSHYFPPPIKGTAVLYISANFNKHHIMLDLKQEGDRAIALKIIEKSDVFIQNMRPGAVERLGLGYDAISHVNPQIVYVAASAYGRSGPMVQEAGIDPTIQLQIIRTLWGGSASLLSALALMWPASIPASLPHKQSPPHSFTVPAKVRGNEWRSYSYS